MLLKLRSSRHTNPAESLGSEYRMTAGATPCYEYLRSAVIGQWCKWRERQHASQGLIEAQRLLAYRYFHPSRVWVLFILVAHVCGDPAADRGQALDACAQRLFFERFANLLAQDLGYWSGRILSKKSACVAQGIEREICCDSEQKQGRYRFVVVQQRL